MTGTSSRITLAFVALLAVAACGDDDSADPTDAPAASGASDGTDASSDTTAAAPADDPYGAPAGTGAPATTADGEPAAGDATVAAAETELGTVLVDGEGMTLYMFMPDAQGPSTCVDQCLNAWPALAGPATAGDGVDEALLGTAARPDDGTEQVTVDGWPVYYFAQDAAPGDVTGQGVGDVWFALDADGEPIPAG